MLDQKILLAYKGEFNHQIVNSILSNAKKQMQNMDIDMTIRKKLYNIMVECLENINRYAGADIFVHDDSTPHYPVFLMGRSDEGYYVTVGNLIRDKDKIPLQQKIEDVNELNKEELKEKYREAIMSADVTEDSGAGLGLIDMAIKSDNKLEYTFNNVKDGVSFFILEVKV